MSKLQNKSKPVLEVELSRIAKALERQNDFKRRFLVGVVFGLGTALGASIVASLIILSFSSLLSAFGLDQFSPIPNAAQVLEEQLRNQTPQE